MPARAIRETLHLEVLDASSEVLAYSFFSSVLSALLDYFSSIVSPSVEHLEGRRKEWQASKTEMPSVPQTLMLFAHHFRGVQVFLREPRVFSEAALLKHEHAYKSSRESCSNADKFRRSEVAARATSCPCF